MMSSPVNYDDPLSDNQSIQYLIPVHFISDWGRCNNISNYIHNLLVSKENKLTVLCNKLELLDPEKVLHNSLKLNKNHVILKHNKLGVISSVSSFESIKTTKVYTLTFHDGEISVKITPYKLSKK